MVMIDPVHSHENKADEVAYYNRHYPEKIRPAVSLWKVDKKNRNCDDNSYYTITESLKPSFTHINLRLLGGTPLTI
jgi:hypothetical protein